MNDQVSAKSGYRPAQPPLPPLTPGMTLVDPHDTSLLAPLVVLSRFASGLHQVVQGRARSVKGEDVRAWPTHSFHRAFHELDPDCHRRDAMNVQAFDAHFVLYGAVNRDGTLAPLVPRLTKPGIYSYLNEDAVGVQAVFGGYLALDYDLPKHGADGGWTADRLDEVSKILHDVGERNPLFKYPTVTYRTKGGLRLVWALASPVAIEGKHGLEDYLTGIVGDAFIAGLAVDPTCRDWTRLFRLPKVRRPKGESDADAEAENTWESGYFSISYNRVDLSAKDDCPTQVIAYEPERFRGISDHKREDYEQSDLARDLLKVSKWASRIGRVPHSFTARVEEIVIGDKPGNLDEHLSYGARQTPTLKAALVKKRVVSLSKRKEAWDATDAGLTYEALYENKPLFSNATKREGLHEGIMRVASFLTRHLVSAPNIDAQVIYALVLTAAFRSNELRTGSGRRSREDMEKEVWDIVSYMWRNDSAKKVVEAEVIEEEAEAKDIRRASHVQSLEGIIKMATNQVMVWLDKEPIQQERARQRIKNWFIVQMPDGTRHVLRRRNDGSLTYGPGVKGLPGLGCQVRDCGHDYIKINKNDIGDDKAVSWKSEMDIMNEYGTTLFKRVLSRHEDVNSLRPIDTDSVAFVEAIPGFRTDIPAVEHEDVDQWLRHLGGSQAEKLLDWCAAVPDLRQPIAALYLQKQSSAGKGMLGLALAQMTKMRSYTPFEQALGEFQDTMSDSPFIWGDEETGSPKNPTRTLMNTFKRLVTGEYNTLNMKGEKHIQIEGHWRILLTANNTDILKIKQDINENDQDALKTRLLRVTPSIEAVRYLEALGGREGTANWPTKKIPEHIMWLAKNRIVKPGKRMIVEGSVPKEDADDNILGLNSEAGDTVVRALGKILQERFDQKYGDLVKDPKGCFKIDLKNSLFWVNSDALHDWMVHLFSNDRSVKVPVTKMIGSALKHISNNAEAVRAQAGKKKGNMVRLHPLPLHKIISTLDREGQNSDFRNNGVITDEYYREYLPELHAQMAAPDDEHEPVYSNGSANGHHPAPQTSNNPVRPMNWTALRPAPKTN